MFFYFYLLNFDCFFKLRLCKEFFLMCQIVLLLSWLDWVCVFQDFFFYDILGQSWLKELVSLRGGSEVVVIIF